MKTQLNTCPKCSSRLTISQYCCPECKISIDGEFTGCTFCNLSDDDRLFALVFIQTEGNMKDMERLMGISYPTVKTRIASVNAILGSESRVESIQETVSPSLALSSDKRSDILDRLSKGEITADEAVRLLKGETAEMKKYAGISGIIRKKISEKLRRKLGEKLPGIAGKDTDNSDDDSSDTSDTE